MEDVKWLLRRCGLPILLLLIFVIAGVFCWGKLPAEKQKVAEEVWEPTNHIKKESEQFSNILVRNHIGNFERYMYFCKINSTPCCLSENIAYLCKVVQTTNIYS